MEGDRGDSPGLNRVGLLLRVATEDGYEYFEGHRNCVTVHSVL